jgi:hypothetical protein
VRSRLAAEPTLANRRYKPPDSDALPPALRVVAAAKEVSHPDSLGRGPAMGVAGQVDHQAAGRTLVGQHVPAVHDVAAGATAENIYRCIVLYAVMPRSADGVLNQGTWIAMLLEGVVDIAAHIACGRFHSKLRLGEFHIAVGRNVGRLVARIIRKIVGVVSATVSNGHEDVINHGRTLPKAIDERSAGLRRPRIDDVAAVDREVGAKQFLKCRDVILHIGLGMVPRMAIGHDCVL